MSPPQSLWQAFQKPPDFFFRDWERVIGDKKCFHVVGFDVICKELGLGLRQDFSGPRQRIDIKQLAADALEHEVLARWKEEFGQGDGRMQKEWTQFGVEQVLHCYAQRPMLLQKAAIAVLFLDRLVRHLFDEAGHSNRAPDICKYIYIEPAVYFVDGFNKRFHERFLNTRQDNTSRREATIAALIKATKQENWELFDDLTEGECTCTRATAEAIVKYYAKKGNPHVKGTVSFKVISAHGRQPASIYETPAYTRGLPPHLELAKLI